MKQTTQSKKELHANDLMYQALELQKIKGMPTLLPECVIEVKKAWTEAIKE